MGCKQSCLPCFSCLRGCCSASEQKAISRRSSRLQETSCFPRWFCCCCQCSCCSSRRGDARLKPRSTRPSKKPDPKTILRTTPSPFVERRDGGFDIEVRKVAGGLYKVPGVAHHQTIAQVKERLVAVDMRFRTHRAELVLGAHVLNDSDTLEDCGVGPGTRLVAVFSDIRAAVLVIGGGVAGRTAIKELSPVFENSWIILVDPKEFSEHACGILRAYADPVTWEALVMRYEDVVSRYPNVQFIQGQVTRLRPSSAAISAMDGTDVIVKFRYCVIATGCNFSAPAPAGGSALWQPSSLIDSREASAYAALDERTVGGRRRRIVEEHRRLWSVHDKGGTVLVVGADYHGVEWACDLKHYFPGLNVTIVDSLPRPLATLPLSAADYAEQYMEGQGIKQFYDTQYEPANQDFWDCVGFRFPADLTYVMTGVLARNSFMPPLTVSSRGPGGGGWIVTNTRLQVCVRRSQDRPSAQVWAGGRIFAVGDCHYGAVVGPENKPRRNGNMFDKFLIPPVPKTALAAMCWAQAACRNIQLAQAGWPLEETAWPDVAGIIAVSLGPADGVVAWKVKWTKDSGEAILFGEPAAEMKRRLSWPDELSWLVDPSKWLATFKEGLPAGRLLSQQGRAALRMSNRAW